jgi:hypothetical protein
MKKTTSIIVACVLVVLLSLGAAAYFTVNFIQGIEKTKNDAIAVKAAFAKYVEENIDQAYEKVYRETVTVMVGDAFEYVKEDMSQLHIGKYGSEKTVFIDSVFPASDWRASKASYPIFLELLELAVFDYYRSLYGADSTALVDRVWRVSSFHKLRKIKNVAERLETNKESFLAFRNDKKLEETLYLLTEIGRLKQEVTEIRFMK